MDRPKDKNIYQVIQKSETSGYLCLYLLNALAKSDNIWHTLSAVYNEYCTEYLFLFTRGRD